MAIDGENDAEVERFNAAKNTKPYQWTMGRRLCGKSGRKQTAIGSEGGKEGIAVFYETKYHSMGGIGEE